MKHEQWVKDRRWSAIFSKNDRTLTIKFQPDGRCHISQGDVETYNDMMREAFEPPIRVSDSHDLPEGIFWEEFTGRYILGGVYRVGVVKARSTGQPRLMRLRKMP